MLDFNPATNGGKTTQQLAAELSKADLYRLTDEMIDAQLAIIADAIDADVAFVPLDPQANDTFGKPEEAQLSWTLGHVVVHATASSEESAALALTLARGIEVKERSRYETPWEGVSTVAQLHQRLAESRRMRKALLDAWPDEPNLELTYAPYARAGQINAPARFISGLGHDTSHLEQLQEIMRQCREANPR